jgi:hypothetical protein
LGALEGFFWGLLGGRLGELLNWFNIRHQLHRGVPDWSNSWLYWTITILMAAAGGVLVFAYLKTGATLNPLIAINLGISAPLLLKTLSAQVPPIDPGSAG